MADRIPRYDLVTELLVTALAHEVQVDPDQFRAWTRGVETPPEWFVRAIQTMVEPHMPPGHPLTSAKEPSTLSSMSTEVSSDVNGRRSRALMSDEARKTRAGRHALERGISFGEISAYLERELKRPVPHVTVRSWFRSGHSTGYRSIPRDAAKALEKKPYEFPGDAWPKVGK